MVFKRSKAGENIKKSLSKDKKNIFQNQKEAFLTIQITSYNIYYVNQ